MSSLTAIVLYPLFSWVNCCEFFCGKMRKALAAFLKHIENIKRQGCVPYIYIYMCVYLYRVLTAMVMEIQELLGYFKTEISNVEIDTFLFKILGSERFSSFFFKEINTYIQKESNKLIKSYHKTLYR